jgi:sulfoxide reductase heme-binding subunit YedZ
VTFLEKLLRSKPFVIALIVLGGLWPAWPIVRGDPSVLADPLKYLLHHTGFMAALLLVIVLAFTPLRVLFPHAKWPLALSRHRRLVGVSVFAYAVLHLTLHFLYEGGFSTFPADVRKPFIVTGLIAFLILFALTVTSTNRAVRGLGAKRWKNLHRWVYLAVALALYHQAASHKIFGWEDLLWYAGPLVLLEAARIIRRTRELSATRTVEA